jgi:hypothetical protein
MIVLTDKQLHAFTDAHLRQFESEMAEHIREFFPDHFRVAGEDTVRVTIRYGHDRAASHGFTTKRNVCLYLNNMILFGSGFDHDPQCPWALEILSDEKETDLVAKSDRLSDAGIGSAEKINGADNRHALRMLLTLTENAEAIYDKMVAASINNVPEILNEVFPNKYKAIGETAVRKLVLAGTEGAARYGIRPHEGAVIFIVAMYVLGSGFHRDPLFPWAQQLLNDPNLPDPEERLAMVYEKMIHQFRTFLSGYNNKEKTYV